MKQNGKINVLVFNCGSSSLKYRLIQMPGGKEIVSGEAQRINSKTSEKSRIIHKKNGAQKIFTVEIKDHESAFREIIRILSAENNCMPGMLGHRVVHGGGIFREHTFIDDAVIKKLKLTKEMAPLHNPPAVSLIESCRKLYPEMPQAAVFDTVYHSTIPWHAAAYAIPYRIKRKYKIKKYGFHGTSHQYVVKEAAKFLNKPLDKFKAVSCHLGSGGASLCAVINGKSVDNTMGYSPLPGLVMSTRSGDIDPAITLQMSAMSGGNFSEMEKILNKKSGVLGMSGVSSDIRDILAASDKTKDLSSRSSRTLDLYLWRLRKKLGSYLAVTGRPDAVIFTDTIGELVPRVRRAVCSGMENFGLNIDCAKNSECGPLPADVSSEKSGTRILVIATNEELAIAEASAEIAERLNLIKGA